AVRDVLLGGLDQAGRAVAEGGEDLVQLPADRSEQTDPGHHHVVVPAAHDATSRSEVPVTYRSRSTSFRIFPVAPVGRSAASTTTTCRPVAATWAPRAVRTRSSRVGSSSAASSVSISITSVTTAPPSRTALTVQSTTSGQLARIRSSESAV